MHRMQNINIILKKNILKFRKRRQGNTQKTFSLKGKRRRLLRIQGTNNNRNYFYGDYLTKKMNMYVLFSHQGVMLKFMSPG